VAQGLQSYLYHKMTESKLFVYALINSSSSDFSLLLNQNKK